MENNETDRLNLLFWQDEDIAGNFTGTAPLKIRTDHYSAKPSNLFTQRIWS